ncbi:hypothetical protein [Nostoc sp. 'Peltigera malacea cyanobiont' DB3992]|uniref:hypothetical protein n=1 Tax=Nostoc sp. 'Peltigera malacea cyanobiont' DB3992 TaxID=1206980 RepID=UPI000C03DE09|nr:hypothetical protein [Nostoc sp. 'Peltigera malacea cyanobiont' DB3992]PHM11641.1 hypothetical protein CK516_01495 [Nostoc sp. 'Peltigera malacea cyanobiont' DB3992]
MSDQIIRVTIYQPKRIPNVYRPPMGLPLNWTEETSAELPRAVFRFFGSHQLSPEEISLIAEYCQYYINAPCWDANEQITNELAALRQPANSLSTVVQINQWINGCLEIGITPF